MNTLNSIKPKSCNRVKVAIVGGGISGLSSAYFLLRDARTHGVDIEPTIFEARAELGGAIRTVNHDGLVLDQGPECFVSTKPAVIEIARELNFDSKIIGQAQRKTFIAGDSNLCEIPEGLLSMSPKIAAFLKSRLFSLQAKARMAAEPFVRPRCGSKDESVANFLLRRFGPEFLEKLAEPMIGGLYGTDPSMLSARSTMPHLVALESEHGSVIFGMLKDRLRQRIERDRMRTLAKSSAGTMSTFDEGMAVLVDELRTYLHGRSRIVYSKVDALWRDARAGKWIIKSADQAQERFDAVVIALPAPDAVKLLLRVDETLSFALSSIKYSSPVVVSLTFDETAFVKPLIGSGFLVPKQLRRTVRACTFSSNKFKRVMSKERSVLRASCNVADHQRSDAEITSSVVAELREYLGSFAEPQLSIVTRHESAIPQFAPGHGSLLESIEKRKEMLPNFALVGNAYGGMGVSDCVMRASNESERLLEQLATLVRN